MNSLDRKVSYESITEHNLYKLSHLIELNLFSRFLSSDSED